MEASHPWRVACAMTPASVFKILARTTSSPTLSLTAPRLPLGALRPLQRPAHDMSSSFLSGTFTSLRRPCRAPRRRPGARFRDRPTPAGATSTNLARRHQPVAAGRRQPGDAVDVARGERDAVLHLRGAVVVVVAAAGVVVEQPAADVGVEGAVGALLLQLVQAAAAAAVAQALPFGLRHVAHRLARQNGRSRRFRSQVSGRACGRACSSLSAAFRRWCHRLPSPIARRRRA